MWLASLMPSPAFPPIKIDISFKIDLLSYYKYLNQFSPCTPLFQCNYLRSSNDRVGRWRSGKKGIGSNPGSKYGMHSHAVFYGKSDKVYQFFRSATTDKLSAEQDTRLSSGDHLHNLFMCIRQCFGMLINSFKNARQNIKPFLFCLLLAYPCCSKGGFAHNRGKNGNGSSA